MIGPEAKLDERARVGDSLVLPAVVGLEAAESVFGGGIPLSGGRTAQVVLADQSFLYLMRAFGIDLLLTTDFLRSLAFA